MGDFLRGVFGADAGQQLTIWAMVLGTALLILLIGLWLARRVATIVRRAVDRRAQDAMLANFIGHTVFVLLAMVVVVGALDRLGVPTASLLAALGAAGLAVGLALKDSIGNLASGVLLVVTRPFRAGDLVEAGGKQGIVERIDLLQTVLLTPDNCIVCVPNAADSASPKAAWISPCGRGCARARFRARRRSCSARSAPRSAPPASTIRSA